MKRMEVNEMSLLCFIIFLIHKLVTKKVVKIHIDTTFLLLFSYFI